MKIAAYDENSTSFLAHKTKQVLNEVTYAGPKTANYIDGDVVSGSVERFYGAVAIPGGVVLVPYSAGVVGLLGASGAYTAGPAAAGSARFRGGCLTDNGKVIFAPSLARNVGIYDIKTNMFSLGAGVSAGTASGSGFAGCCKMKNGLVFMAPRNRNTVGIYNPYTNAYADGPAHGQGADAWSGCVPLPDGKVLMIPYNADVLMTYDYKTNALETVATVAGSAQFSGGVALSNGDVVMAPYSKTQIGIYRFATGKLYLKLDPALSGSNKFQGAALTYDGRVVFVPHDHGNVMYYDPTNDTLVTTTEIVGDNKFSGAAQLPNGKIAFAPYNHTNIGIVDTNAGYASSDALRANMYFNSTI